MKIKTLYQSGQFYHYNKMKNLITKFILSFIISQSFFLWIGPRLVMSKLDKDLEESRINFREECGQRWVDGVIYSDPICIGDAASSRKPNPDFIYTIIPYDLRKGDLYVSMPVPSNDRYWSIHAHNRNTDAFYRISNTEIDKDKFEFLITRDKSKPADIPIAYATSKKGVILNRLVMKDFSEYEMLDTFRRYTFREYR